MRRQIGCLSLFLKSSCWPSDTISLWNKMTLVFINNPPDAWWEMSMPHSRVFCVAAQYFSLFCSRISLTGLAADERGVHNPSWKNCIAQHTCSRIAWLLSTIRFGLFLNKNAAFFGWLLYLTYIKNDDFWETTFLWNLFLQCFVQTVNYSSRLFKMEVWQQEIYSAAHD